MFHQFVSFPASLSNLMRLWRQYYSNAPFRKSEHAPVEACLALNPTFHVESRIIMQRNKPGGGIRQTKGIKEIAPLLRERQRNNPSYLFDWRYQPSMPECPLHFPYVYLLNPNFRIRICRTFSGLHLHLQALSATSMVLAIVNSGSKLCPSGVISFPVSSAFYVWD